MAQRTRPVLFAFVFSTFGIQAAIAGDALDASLATKDPQEAVLWYNLQNLDLEGKGWNDTKSYFDRLPEKAEEMVRDAVWKLSRHSAGLCTRFVTDATTIKARWTLTSARLAMPHMPATGVSGLDLYVRLDDGRWRWLAVGRPGRQSNSVTLISKIPSGRREFLLYLPLYNGVTTVEIGIPEQSALSRAQPREPRQRKPIVFYGTSITQGGCASRPGMVHTAILGRRLNLPVINLGFSGNGRMEPELARLMTELDPAVYVIDCLPNLKAPQVAERVMPLVDILREARPTTPILLVEDRSYTNSFLLAAQRQRNVESRIALKTAYEQLKSAGDNNLYYLAGDTLLGEDGEDTVDSSHPTDLGFMRQADAFETALRPILELDPRNNSTSR